MTMNTVCTAVPAVAALLTALYYLGRKLLVGLEASLRALVPVILAWGEVREAWRGLRYGAVAPEEEERRALP